MNTPPLKPRQTDRIFIVLILGLILCNLVWWTSDALRALWFNPDQTKLWMYLIIDILGIVCIFWLVRNYRRARRLRKEREKQEREYNEWKREEELAEEGYRRLERSQGRHADGRRGTQQGRR